MTTSTTNNQAVEKELISALFQPGTKVFLENYRRENGLRSSSEALRRIVSRAAGEHELAKN